MEQLGYKFKNDNDNLKRELETANICFLHAPLFHPALKVVGPIRKNLGVRTFFNMLGPMVNPAFPNTSWLVFITWKWQGFIIIFCSKRIKHFTIIHSLDGYDEISLTGDTKVITNEAKR